MGTVAAYVLPILFVVAIVATLAILWFAGRRRDRKEGTASPQGGGGARIVGREVAPEQDPGPPDLPRASRG